MKSLRKGGGSMKTFIVAAILWFAMALNANAGTEVIDFDGAVGATSYQIQQSVDFGVTWTVNAKLPACSGTPIRCVVTVTLPDTGYVLLRTVATNAQGSAIRYKSGIWHCQSCTPPTGLPLNVGVQ
jgi:hypothetical protein